MSQSAVTQYLIYALLHNPLALLMLAICALLFAFAIGTVAGGLTERSWWVGREWRLLGERKRTQEEVLDAMDSSQPVNRVLVHSEDGCNTPLVYGRCPRCGFAPSMQDTAIIETRTASFQLEDSAPRGPS